jgi:hypothetical protein
VLGKLRRSAQRDVPWRMRRTGRLLAIALLAVVIPTPDGTVRPVSAGPVEALLVGDSVMNGLAQSYGAPARALLASRHSFILDAAGCRRLVGTSCHIGSSPPPTNAITALISRAGQYDKALVMAAGYNDSNIGGAVDIILAEARRQGIESVIWLTYREAGTSSHIAQYRSNNDVLREKRAQYPELRLADWAALSAGMPASWFSADGLHLGGSAATAMAGLIADSLDAAIAAKPDRCSPARWQGDAPLPVAPGSQTAAGGGVSVLPEPIRLLDTRELPGAVGAGRVVGVPVAGVNGVPSDATAAITTVTAVDQCMAGYLTAFPCGTGVPTASVANAEVGATIANSVVVMLGGGALCVYSSQATDVLVDLSAWIGPGGAAATLPAPLRLVDTRPGEDQALAVAKQRVAAHGLLPIDVGNLPDIDAGVTAVSINLTAAAPAGDGFLTALSGPCDLASLGPTGPRTSNVNVSTGHDAAASTTVGIGAGQFCVYSSVDTDVVVDLNALHRSSGSAIAPISPARAIDTRESQRVPAGGVVRVDLGAIPSAPASLAGAIANITAVSPSSAGYLTAYSCALPRPPTVSNVNTSPGITTANRAVVATDGRPEMCVYSSVDTDIVVDVEAWLL